MEIRLSGVAMRLICEMSDNLNFGRESNED